MDNQNQPLQPANNPLPTPNQPISPPQTPANSRTENFKRRFFQVLIACLIGSATIAVTAVLVGSFSDTLGRALGTIVMVALHATFSFSYINDAEKRNKKDGGRSIELFSNIIFTLIVISFITSIFAIWELLGAELTVKLYLFYGVLLFATLHADVLYRIRRFEKKIDTVVSVNYITMAIVVMMLAYLIFSGGSDSLGTFFYRLLAAFGIIDATLTITAIILHKLFLQKHPELQASAASANSARSKNFWRNPVVVLLLIFLLFQVVGTLVAFFIRGLK